MIIEIDPSHPEPRKIQRAAAALEAGQVIAYPTDAVYALGCDLFNKKAIDSIYEIKRMSRDQPLAFICHDLGDIARYAIVENNQYRLLRRLLPGPYTFILEATREVPKLVVMKRKQVGIRIPDHPVTLALTKAFGRPIVSTTAAPHGQPAYVDAHEIAHAYPRLGLVLDAGVGGEVPTTVVDITGGKATVVREGAGDPDLFRGSLPPDL
jgi:tRNA threonylcarbamoyl adenosine modification protein (Sua5/YciO/YrdC/YwlC family)